MKILLLSLLAAALASAQSSTASLNVVWDSPSKDSSGSMPLGNGDIGLNVWVEDSGDLVFYIGKTDAWSETVRLLKVGRVRVRLSPNPFSAGAPFRQTLDPAKGEIVVTGGNAGVETTVRVWVDANNPVIRVEAESKQRFNLFAFYERWRDQQRRLEGKEAESAYGLDGGPDPVISYPDSIVMEGEDRVAWYHRNAKSAWMDIMKHQGLAAVAAGSDEPLLNRTFGALMTGDGCTRMNPAALRSRTSSNKQSVSIFVLTATADTGEAWVRQAEGLAGRVSSLPVADRRAAHERWWQQFWDRSFIRTSGSPAAGTVSRGYVLQRFITACAGRGAFPIKFNGSIFNVDAVVDGARFDADYRRWGGPYWFQNTRLIYWPLLASGDFEMMQPLFRMYNDALLMARRRTRVYFDHDGAFFPETMYFWGAYANSNYGWKREGQPNSWVENTYIRHYYSSSLELLAMMIDYYAYTQDKEFARTTLAPFATEIIRFYDGHYKRDGAGRMVIAPAQALETWPDVVNPLPEIAGLRYVIARLQQEKAPLDKKVLETARRIVLQIPPVPTKQEGEKKLLAAGEKIQAKIQNSENPELYAVFPYKLFGVNRPEYEMARQTFEARNPRGTGGWRQDAIWAAHLGLAEQARDYVVENFSSKNPESRFPAFWGPNYDWVPDQDHGCSAQIALQSMLLQTDGDKILLFPAWPKDWDVEFKLAAPKNTTIEVVYSKGEIRSLKVTPAARAADIVKLAPQ